MLDLFAQAKPRQEPLASGAVILRRFAFDAAPSLLQEMAVVVRQSPFRQMVTPGGYTMSVAMTNCGQLGWTTDQHGYLYSPVDPLTGSARRVYLTFCRTVSTGGDRCGLSRFPTRCLFDQPLYAVGKTVVASG